MDRLAAIVSELGIGVVRATLLLLAAVLAALVLRRAAAAVRHQLWAGVLVALLVLPLAGALLPELPLRLLRRVPLEPAGPIPSPYLTPWLPPGDVSVAPHVPRVAVPDDPPRVEAAPPAPVPRLPLALGALWSLGAAAVAWRFLRARVRARRLLSGTSPVDRALWPAPAHIDVRAGEHVELPMTVGALRPVILVPAIGAEWPAGWRAAVLAHEAAHVRRRDPLLLALAELACALYWFHPLVWLAARQLRTERELAADDDVLTSGFRPSEYADLLVTLSCLPVVPPTAGAVLPLLTPAGLKARLLGIVEAGRRRTASRLVRAGLALAGLALFVPTANAVLVPRGQLWFPPGVLLACARDRDSGKPIAGAEVDVWDGEMLAQRVATGSDGCIRWFREPPHTGEVVAYVRKGTQAGRQLVRPGPFGTVLPATIDVHPALSVSGIVRDDGGRPAPGVLVRVVWSQTFARGPGPDAVAFSGADGRFRFEGLLYGNYRLYFEGPSGGVATALVTLNEQDLADVEARLSPRWPVTGHLRSPSGDPVIGARIEESSPFAREPGRRLRGQHVDWDVSDETGAFRMVSLGRGLRATGRDSSGRLVSGVFVDAVRRPSQVSWGAWDAGRPAEPRTIVLQPAGVVRGVAHFPDGQPAGRVSVQALVWTDGPRRAVMFDRSVRAFSDEQGHFVVGPLPLGQVELHAYATAPSFLQRRGYSAVQVVQVNGEQDPEVDLLLQPR